MESSGRKGMAKYDPGINIRGERSNRKLRQLAMCNEQFSIRNEELGSEVSEKLEEFKPHTESTETRRGRLTAREDTESGERTERVGVVGGHRGGA